MQKSVKSRMENAFMSELSEKLKYFMPPHLKVTVFSTFAIQ
jgi:hypothetical protein